MEERAPALSLSGGGTMPVLPTGNTTFASSLAAIRMIVFFNPWPNLPIVRTLVTKTGPRPMPYAWLAAVCITAWPWANMA